MMHSKNSNLDATNSVQAWLSNFSCFVQEENYHAASKLFAPEVFAFGTLTDSMNGLEELIELQWRNIWGNTRGFTFQSEEIVCDARDDIAWVAAKWNSQKQDASGVWTDRPGRATFVLKRVDNSWLAVHSHLSLNPSLLGIQKPLKLQTATSIKP